ncbi:MAG: SDR family oxidoreductase [Deltaproteobacteria bacterium]|jgi:NAD(P)-dependent dehydrogenase (short-subunit alcohol dehydrogenase family)|nr:SDR family oxidoreductase [Deltaproteobacteria bacterium]
MDADFSGKTAIVTGAAGGIGAATARRFAEAGAALILGDLNGAALEALCGELADITQVHAVTFDVTRVADCEALIARAVGETGRVDVLVNTAGVWVEGPSEAMTEEQWDRTIDVNLKGTFFCCRYAIPQLKKTQGRIINLSSDAGVVGTPETALYTASKGGVSLLTKSLALELAPHLVGVNAVCPADVMTPMLEGQARDFGGGDEEGYFKRLLSSYAQGDKARFIEQQEVAALIFYLASPLATPITGACVAIDFGTTAGYGYSEGTS